jgi:hypothetical protein
MKTIGDLDRLGSALADAVGKGAGLVVGNDFRTAVLFKPRCQRLGLSVGQMVDCASAFEIADNPAVMLATPEGDVIDAEYTRRFGGLQDDRLDQAQHSAGAERHPQPAGETGAGFTAQRQAEALLRLAQAEGAAGHRHGDLRQPLGENSPWTSVIDAAKAADLQVEFDPTPLPQQIRQPAIVHLIRAACVWSIYPVTLGGLLTQRQP